MTRRFNDVLLAAVALALAAGTVSGATAWVRRAFLGDFLRTWMSADIGWTAPLGYLILFVPLALLVGLLVSVVRRAPALSTGVFVFGSLAAFGTLLLFPRIHQYASLALSLGIGAQLARTSGRNADAWRRRLSRVAVVFALVPLGLWAWQTVSGAQREKRAMAALPDAAAGAPNVLLIILDTVRASALSLYGAERTTTPRLATWAEAATVFEWAFSTAPWTLPSHASMFTGVYPSQHSGDWAARLAATHPTLAEVFGAAGYATGGFTANLIATPRGTGLERGFHRYQDYPRSLGQIVLSTALGQAESPRDAWTALVEQGWVGGALRALARFSFLPRYSYPDNANKDAARVSAEFLSWQKGLGERPFFAFLNYFDAHGPFLSPERYDTVFGPGTRARDKYDRSIRYLDDELAGLMDTLAARGLLDRTVVVITSDHGEQFGEHGLGWHSNSLYTQLLHVPLLVRFPPRVPAGARVSQQVSLRDLAATMVDLSAVTGGSALGGVSLASMWVAAGAAASPAYAELSRGINPDPIALNRSGDMRSIADDSLHVIRNGDGSVEVYAYRRDPAEEQNLAAGPHRAVIPAFEAAMRAAVGKAPGDSSGRRTPQ